MTEKGYCKRLIEVDLPIKRISAQSQRDKSIRQGHISTLHVWWARRPLAACRAIVCSSLWLDPADPAAPVAYVKGVAGILRRFARAAMQNLRSAELLGSSFSLWKEIAEHNDKEVLQGFTSAKKVRHALLDFVGALSDWDASTEDCFLTTARELTSLAHRHAFPDGSERPLVIDPFAGGGAIPFEALRVGADVFATDLNPVSVLLNRVELEYAPKLREALRDEVEKWATWIGREAKDRLAEFYPADADGATPIAYIWARTVRCEGPRCGRIVPLVRSFWLTKRNSGSAAVTMSFPKSAKIPSFEVIIDPDSSAVPGSTVRKAAAICPWPNCGYTTPAERVRAQLAGVHGGADTAVLLAVVTNRPTGERAYRSPSQRDAKAVTAAKERLDRLNSDRCFLTPDEQMPPRGTLGFRVQNYGIATFGDLTTARQKLALGTIASLLRDVEKKASSEVASATLSLALGRLQDLNSSLSRWADTVVGANAGQNRLSMTWDFAEAAPLAGAGGGWAGQTEWILRVLDHITTSIDHVGSVAQAPAQRHPLPDDTAHAFITDPPYYDAFGYADLSDLFFVWLKRATANPAARFPTIGVDGKTPKNEEIVVNPGASSDGRGAKDHAWFYSQMRLAFEEARRVTHPAGIGVIVFAHKDTKSWEALLQGVIDAGWIVTASWPIATERPTRQRAIGSAALASSVHLVCRPREDANGQLRDSDVGDWRDILRELPQRIAVWMPRLAKEGVVGADSIFACLGPALEVFSKYARVEKANGEVVALSEYLEHVWAAVAKQALSMVLDGADTAGLEPDGRLTAIWLWTLSGGAPVPEAATDDDEDTENEDATPKKQQSGFTLEYDAARKLAQGLGAHLEELDHLIEIRGDAARLLPVTERARFLFAKSDAEATGKTRKKKSDQSSLFADLDAAADAGAESRVHSLNSASTTLDRIHQAMILFGAGRGEALKRFLVEEGGGNQPQFWKLSQSLSALYPSGTDEKRWIDGVLARKKSFGFA